MKKFYNLITCLFIAGICNAQLEIDAVGSPVTIDFTGFTGAGFQPGGGAGMLNSDDWIATGFSEGDLDFGATAITGDFARGSTMGLETIGGIYGVDIAGNQGLMVQPTADDFTAGGFILKLINNTGTDIGSIDLSYTIYVLNDAGRSNSFNFSVSNDNITYMDIAALDYASPEAADFSPYIELKSTTISGFLLADGDMIYLKWWGNDVGGGGTRDEFALDDISITGNGAMPYYNFDETAVTVNEGDLSGSFDITLSESADCTLHFGYGADATATAGFDYGLMGFTLDFTAGGATTQNVVYGLVDDLTAEVVEIGIIQIVSADGGCVAGMDTTFTINIEDNELVTPPIASFTTIGATEDEGIGTVTGTIELTEAADCELQMYLDGATTMTEGSDYTFTLPANFTFSIAGTTSQSFDIDIIDDASIETTEMLLMNLTVISGTCAIGAIADFEINITDNDAGVIYTVYDIAEVTTEDVDGNADSDGALVDLTGIVYGVNLWDGGLQFTLIDETGGINVFSFDQTFGYTVTEGDEVNVKGVITQFNGLTEIEPDELTLMSSGNALKFPTFNLGLNESTESDLIDLGVVSFPNESQWLGDGYSFNVDIIAQDGNTYILRIDNNTELSLLAVPPIGEASQSSVIGIGTQFDTDSPYTTGYQIMPRYLSDIVPELGAIEQLDPTQISIFPNPTMETLNFSGKENIEWVEIINQLGETVQSISINDFDASVDVVTLPAGLYFLKIKTDTGIYSSNFVKQ